MNSFWVVLGEHSYDNTTESNMTKKFEVEEILVHTNKFGNPTKVDIALVKVKEVIDVEMYTPLCLIEEGYDVRGENITLTGDRCPYTIDQ